MGRIINSSEDNIAIAKTVNTSVLSYDMPLNNINRNNAIWPSINKHVINRRDLNLLDSFANPVNIIGIDKKIEFVNRAFENLTKFSVAEVTGIKPPYLWWPKGMARSYSARLAWAMRLGGSRYEHLFHDKDGKEFWVAIHLTPIVHHGALNCYIANWVNITQQKENNQRITRELYQNEKKLRHNLQTEINRRGRYLRLLIHELKTPMTATLYSSVLLSEQLTNETHLKLARNIYRAISSLNNRIDELMDLAKGEMEMIDLHLTKVNVRELLLQIADDFDSITWHNGKSLKLELPAHIPSIQCDQDRIRQILHNLLNNAVKFTNDGAEIVLRAIVAENNLIIEVQDTGPGISKQDQRWLFTPYCNVRKNKESYSGLGLGLSLCKVLVELHEGYISVKSQIGKGTKISCTFPLEPINNS